MNIKIKCFMLPLPAGPLFPLSSSDCFLHVLPADLSGHSQSSVGAHAHRTAVPRGDRNDVRPVLHVALARVVPARGVYRAVGAQSRRMVLAKRELGQILPAACVVLAIVIFRPVLQKLRRPVLVNFTNLIDSHFQRLIICLQRLLIRFK